MENKNGQRITIGFLIHHLDNDYSRTLLKGASAAARELDVNLAIFPGRSLNCRLDDKKYAVYEYQNNVIYSLASAKSLDAAVVSAGTLSQFVTAEDFKEFLDGYEGLPIITTENKVEGYPCARMSGSGIKDIVAHLVREHNCRHIAYVSGPKGNADADERLNCYIEALEENGLEYDPDMIAYGRFSEYCVDIVGSLIDKNIDKIDAICFANDMMCKGGYKAIEKRGLRVGEDIAVAGYDDSEVAVSLNPMLTTVRADASALGGRAVREAVKMVLGKSDRKDIALGSFPVFRASCGCSTHSGALSREGQDLFTEDMAFVTADNILQKHIPRYEEFVRRYQKIASIREFLVKFFVIVASSSSHEEDEVFSKRFFSAVVDNELFKLVPPEKVVRIIKDARSAADSISHGNYMIERIIANCLETMSEHLVNLHYRTMEDMSFTHFLIGNITKDMTIYGNDEEKCFFSIVNNLYRAHVDSSLIYTYDKPILHSDDEKWKCPETLMLRAYHDGDSLAAVTGESRKIPAGNFLNNDFTPTDRCRVMVVSPLYMCEEQYGFIVCELDNEFFPYIYSITPQICTAIKLTNLVAQLESSLDAAQNRNNMLNRMSMSDELTGVFNRRGFYVNANRILKARENEGKRAVLLFGDLDNLKTINDTFGHDDGDYAIVSAANFIKNSMRGSDVVARIGGDEFAAFALGGDSEITSKLPSRIKNIAKLHNLRSNKPYNVTISIGICEIVCSPDVNIQQYMDMADEALYEDKQHKNRDIMKHDKNDM